MRQVTNLSFNVKRANRSKRIQQLRFRHACHSTKQIQRNMYSVRKLSRTSKGKNTGHCAALIRAHPSQCIIERIGNTACFFILPLFYCRFSFIRELVNETIDIRRKTRSQFGEVKFLQQKFCQVLRACIPKVHITYGRQDARYFSVIESRRKNIFRILTKSTRLCAGTLMISPDLCSVALRNKYNTILAGRPVDPIQVSVKITPPEGHLFVIIVKYFNAVIL